jgi:hypothetical protein
MCKVILKLSQIKISYKFYNPHLVLDQWIIWVNMARIKVRFKPTGQIGTVEDYEFDPKIYDLLEQPETIAPKTKSLAEKIGGGVLGIGKSLAEPFISTGKNIATAGILPVQAGIAQTVGQIAPQAGAKIASADILGTQRRGGEITEKPRNALAEQIANSLDIASWAIPFGSKARAGAPLVERALTKAVLPGAGVGLLTSPEIEKGLKGEQVSPEKLVGQMAIGAAIPVGTAIAGKGLKFITKGGAKVAETVGKKAATKTVRPTKTQIRKFKELTGEEIGEFAVDRNLVGKSADDIYEHSINPLQESFNGIGRESRIMVVEDDLAKSFYDRISPLLDSGSTDDVKLAEKLIKEYDSLINATGLNKGPVNISEITNRKANFDSKVKKWLGNPIEGGKNRLTADSLRQTVQDVAGKAGLVDKSGRNIQEIGRELQKMHAYKDIISIQAGLGKGNLPVGLLSLLGIGGGGVVAGIPGGAGVAAATVLVNNPKALSIFSRLSMKAAGALSRVPEITAPGVAKNIAIRAVTGEEQPIPEQEVTLRGVEQGQKEPYYQEQYEDGYSIEHKSSITQTVTGYTPEQIGQAYSKAIMAGDKESASLIKNMYDMETSYQESIGGGGLQLSDTAIKNVTELQSGIADISTLRNSINESEFVGPLKGQTAKIPWATGPRTLQAEIDTVRQTVGKAIEGGVLRKEDEEKYKKILPLITDTKEVALNKLSLLETKLNEDLQRYVYAQGAYGGGGSTNTLDMMNSAIMEATQ